MDYRSSEIKAGIFVLICLLILIGFMVVIVGLTTLEDKDVYRTRFVFVGGIVRGATVRYAGVEVGRVTDLTFPGDGDPRVEVYMEVTKGTPIKTDSKAFLSTIGLMGAYYIEIKTGSVDAPMLPSGDLIPSEDVTSLSQMSGTLNEVTDEGTELLRQINALLNQETRRHISEMIASLHQITATSANNMEQLFVNLNALTEQLESTTSVLNGVLAANDSVISSSLVMLNDILEQSKVTIDKLNITLSDMDHALVQNTDEYQEFLKNLSTVSLNLNSFTQSIKEQPWTLVRKSYPAERKLP